MKIAATGGAAATRVGSRAYSHSKLPLSCEVVENRSTLLDPNFYGRKTQKLLRQFITVVCHQRLVKFCRLAACAKPGNDEERKIFEGWVKIRVLFFVVSGPTFSKFWDDVAIAVVSNAFPHCLYHVPRRIYLPSNVPLSCEVVENR